MNYKQYKLKYYLNATHHIAIDGMDGETHSHTWELTLDILKVRDNFVKFNELEEVIAGVIGKFQDKNLNETPPFDLINPTVENCCEFFYSKIKEALVSKGWILLMITMSETPTRAYVISSCHKEDYSGADKVTEALIEDILEGIRGESR